MGSRHVVPVGAPACIDRRTSNYDHVMFRCDMHSSVWSGHASVECAAYADQQTGCSWVQSPELKQRSLTVTQPRSRAGPRRRRPPRSATARRRRACCARPAPTSCRRATACAPAAAPTRRPRSLSKQRVQGSTRRPYRPDWRSRSSSEERVCSGRTTGLWRRQHADSPALLQDTADEVFV